MTERWIDHAAPGESVVRKDGEGGAHTITDEEAFVAIRTPVVACANDLPEGIRESIQTSGVPIEYFNDRVHRFKEPYFSMYAVHKSDADQLAAAFRDDGYEVEIDMEYTPFKFLSRHTKGVMVVSPCR